MTGTRSIRQQRSPRAAFLNYGGRKTLHKGWVRALAALPLPRAQDVVTSRYGVKLRANWRDRTFQYCRAATYGRDLSGFLAAQDSPFAFVDIGANQGLYSLLAAGKPQCASVLAFEPVAATFAVLGDNIQPNGREEKYHPVHEPVSLSTGTR